MNKKGFTLLEITLCLAVFSVISFTVLVFSKGIIRNAKIEKTVEDLMGVSRACQMYYDFNNFWPDTLSDLQPEYLPDKISTNVFGNSFDITNSLNLITVSTLVPFDTSDNKSVGSQVVIIDEGSNKRLSVSRPNPAGYTSRLRLNISGS